MSVQFKMVHFWQKQPDGTVHVTNMVGSHTGQHHVHTVASFEEWESSVKAAFTNEFHELTGCDLCDCGLKPGEKRRG